MRREHLRISLTSGGSLEARLESPEPLPAAWALFVQESDVQAASWISLSLVERGIAVLRVTPRPGSEGLDDLIAGNSILLIEWGEKFQRFERERDIEIAIESLGENQRIIRLKGKSLGGHPLKERQES